MALTPDAYDHSFARADAALRAALGAVGLAVTGPTPVVVTNPTGLLTPSPADWQRYTS